MLIEQGRPIIEIAVILNLDVKTVKKYLGAATATTQTAQITLQDNLTQLTTQQPSGQSQESDAQPTGWLF